MKNYVEGTLSIIAEKAAKDEKIGLKLKEHLNDYEFISSLQIKDIIPDDYDIIEDDCLEFSATIKEFSVLGSTVDIIKKVEDEKMGTLLPRIYLDGPFAFELGGRKKVEMICAFVKKVLCLCGVSDDVITRISNRGIMDVD